MMRKRHVWSRLQEIGQGFRVTIMDMSSADIEEANIRTAHAHRLHPCGRRREQLPGTEMQAWFDYQSHCGSPSLLTATGVPPAVYTVQ